MQKIIIAFAFAMLVTLTPVITGTAEAAQPAFGTFPTAASIPVRVIIPSIKLNDPIQNMGVLANGALDVPSGATKNVGWYAAGTVPGEAGSAVLDAHVFAAFANLKNLKVGADIYIVDADGANLHFKVEDSETYPLAQVSTDLLFNRADEPRLNLITCAGKLTPDHSTYDHRLIVYAVLVP